MATSTGPYASTPEIDSAKSSWLRLSRTMVEKNNNHDADILSMRYAVTALGNLVMAMEAELRAVKSDRR